MDEAREPHHRPLHGDERGKHFLHYYERLSTAGLSPRIVAVQCGSLLTEPCVRLEDWLATVRPEAEKRRMGRDLVRRLEEMHSHGICHRDVHLANVVIGEDDVPLFVDPDFATKCIPDRFRLGWFVA